MLYYSFKNYDEFKQIFGIVEHGNGVKSRKNKILLALYKDKQALKSYPKFLQCTDLPTLKNELYKILQCAPLRKQDAWHVLELNGMRFYSDSFETDDFNGLCEDGTVNAIRYRNINKGRVFKMKAGKMFNHILSCNILTSELPEQIKRWLSEEFVAEWVQYASENISDCAYTLHVDDNFRDIYSSRCCKGYDEDGNAFGSCMVDDDQYSFYRDSVDAQAAYLTDADGMIVARCIIFTDVKDEDGRMWRLAERQYSYKSDLALQRQLISALISDGYIDGYKCIGASCHDSRKFVANDGNSLAYKRFSIRCSLDFGDTVSYQDSFKWYDMNDSTAYNYSVCGTEELDITDSTFESNREWSDYNDEYIPQYDACYIEVRDDYFYDSQVVYGVRIANGHHYKENLFEGDCIEINGTYYYAGQDAEFPSDNGIYECDYCGEYYVEGYGYYSEITECDYCCESCMEVAEKDHKEQYWTYSEYDDEYFEGDSEVLGALIWNDYHDRYDETTIHVDTFNELAEQMEAAVYDGRRYIDPIGYGGRPVHLHSEELCAA